MTELLGGPDGIVLPDEWVDTEGGPAPLPTVNPFAGKILVVDDNRVNCQLLTAILLRAGFGHVGTAGDGLEALRMIADDTPDVVLLDLMMPNLDGFEVTRRLRDDPVTMHLPILVQSSLDRPEDRARAFAAGATDYVSKPINAIELISRVRVHLQHRFLVRSLQQYRNATEAELALARNMQQQLLPGRRNRWSVRLDPTHQLEACFAPSSELGGDLWGLSNDAAGRPVIWLADFSGHGAGAALNTFRLHAILKRTDFESQTPASFLQTINSRLCPLLPPGQFATMLVGVFDSQADRFHYASAASTKPLVWTCGDSRTPLHEGDNSGLPLGLLPSAVYETRELPWPANAQALLYSDAAVELPLTDGGVLDEDGLKTLVTTARSRTDGALGLDALIADLGRQGTCDDDLTAVLVTRSA